jgi:hypothetical protein
LIETLLKSCEEELKTPVEIEFAVTFNPLRFGFLQVRPMVVSSDKVEVTEEDLLDENILVASRNVLGNGINNTIKDIVYVKPESFEAKHTNQIARELESINKILVNLHRPYLLIGFGRWGSSDPWLGIPVNWGQVSGAKAIVETGMENLNVEFSQGSHFFHNLTSFNVSYFSVKISDSYKIDWDWLSIQHVEYETDLVRHVSLSSALHTKVDGRSGRGTINKK